MSKKTRKSGLVPMSKLEKLADLFLVFPARFVPLSQDFRTISLSSSLLHCPTVPAVFSLSHYSRTFPLSHYPTTFPLSHYPTIPLSQDFPTISLSSSLLHCPTVLLSYYRSTFLLSHCPTVPLSYCPTVPLSYFPRTFLLHCPTALLFYCPTVPAHFYCPTALLLHCPPTVPALLFYCPTVPAHFYCPTALLFHCPTVPEHFYCPTIIFPLMQLHYITDDVTCDLLHSKQTAFSLFYYAVVIYKPLILSLNGYFLLMRFMNSMQITDALKRNANDQNEQTINQIHYKIRSLRMTLERCITWE